MKRLILIFLLIPSLCFGADAAKIMGVASDPSGTNNVNKVDAITWGTTAGNATKMNGVACAAASLNTVDASRGFEADSDPTGWTKTDTEAKINRYSTAQYKSGSHSMLLGGGTTTVAYYTYDIGSNKTKVSICFWFYTSTTADYSNDNMILSLDPSNAFSGSYVVRVYWRKTGGAGSYLFALSGATGPTNMDANVSTGGWYRVELLVEKNTTSTMKIFNAAGTQVGSTVSLNANNQNIRYIGLGNGQASGVFGDAYFDNFGIDWTDATSPLWEFTVSN